jgi:hypothetical protein
MLPSCSSHINSAIVESNREALPTSLLSGTHNFIERSCNTHRRIAPHLITSHCKQTAINATPGQNTRLALAAAPGLQSVGPSERCRLPRCEAWPNCRQRLCIACLKGCHELERGSRMLAHRSKGLDLIAGADSRASESRSRLQRVSRESW